MIHRLFQKSTYRTIIPKTPSNAANDCHSTIVFGTAAAVLVAPPGALVVGVESAVGLLSPAVFVGDGAEVSPPPLEDVDDPEAASGNSSALHFSGTRLMKKLAWSAGQSWIQLMRADAISYDWQVQSSRAAPVSSPSHHESDACVVSQVDTHFGGVWAIVTGRTSSSNEARDRSWLTMVTVESGYLTLSFVR